MGFDIEGTSVTLEFDEGTVLAGAHIECSLDVTLREFMAIRRLLREADALADTDVEQVEGLHRQIGDAVLRKWDLQRGEVAIAATGEEFAKLPLRLVNTIVGAWIGAATGASPNSSAASVSGDTSGAEPEQTAAG